AAVTDKRKIRDNRYLIIAGLLFILTKRIFFSHIDSGTPSEVRLCVKQKSERVYHIPPQLCLSYQFRLFESIDDTLEVSNLQSSTTNQTTVYI
ncbi:hypothetical protein M2T38_27365, partial [Klebsiella pneumoniae]|nr:hypothetical protein [Klebsiella pneumoniae]